MLSLESEQLDEVLEFLKERPGDYAGAAALIGVERSELITYRKEVNPEAFDKLEESYLDKLEGLCRAYVIGTMSEDERGWFSYPRAMDMLDRFRPEKWAKSPTARAKAIAAKEARTSSGRSSGGKGSARAEYAATKALMEEHLARARNVIFGGAELLDDDVEGETH